MHLEGSARWVDSWRHNDLGLFDTAEIAESVIPIDEREAFTILAYSIWDRMFDNGVEMPLPIALSDRPGPEPAFTTLGFDAVEWSHNSFSCSPLSCNGGAATFSTNELCLFRTVDEATAGAREFSSGNWEPGPYWIVEVRRRWAGVRCSG